MSQEIKNPSLAFPFPFKPVEPVERPEYDKKVDKQELLLEIQQTNLNKLK
jgi:hypothetical protein